LEPPNEGLHRLLTDEEKLVLQLLARGHGIKEIAAMLAVSLEEARALVQIILEKLQVHSRLEAAVFGFRPDPPPLPPAASAALAIPFQRAEDVPTHVGKPLRRKNASALQVL
jgi:DNA-binding CsgD family transcriptional regulator